MRGTVRPVGEYVPVTMEPPVVPDGSVTAAGAGHRAVSLGDVERARRASVLAYCARICDPTRIGEAADAAFAELLAALEAAPADLPVDLDQMLLEATRHAAAERVDAAATASGGRLGPRRSTRTCELMPTLLAGRASERLSASDRPALERHLTKCASCRELAQRRDEAEQAYAALIGAPVEAAEPQEPFAPGDPEPEVFASRSYADTSESEAVDAQADVVSVEPVDAKAEVDAAPEAEVTEPEPDAFDDYPGPEALEDEPELPAPEEEPPDPRLYDPPEFDPPPLAVGTEEFDVLGDEDEGDVDTRARRMPPTWRDGAPIGGKRTRTRRWPSRGLIAGLFIAGVVILAIGLVQLLGGGGDGDSGQRSTARQTTAAPAPAPAQQQPSRAELRRRARVRSLGDRELGPGTSGDDVKALQKLLGVSQTGNYGELTTFAVSDFQSKHGLKATGIADEATKRKLARRSKPPRQAPAPPQSQQTQADEGTAGTTPQGGTGTQPGATGTQPQGTAPQQPAQPAPQAGQPSTGQ